MKSSCGKKGWSNSPIVIALSVITVCASIFISRHSVQAGELPTKITLQTHSKIPTSIAQTTQRLKQNESFVDLPAIRQGMPYEEARTLLIDSGWQAAYIYPMYREAQLSGIEEYIANELGYGEMESCAGTGAGYCRFKFVAADGQQLIVITVGNESGQQPVLHQWWIEAP